MAGNREKDWGKEKKFREGQTNQRLDDLFFDYIETAKILQPKVVLAENVKGLIQGNAKVLTKRIKTEFEKAGYNVQLFLLNAASMGVPQKRERVFFICQRNDLKLPKLELFFDEKAIPFKNIAEQTKKEPHKKLTDSYFDLWDKVEEGRPLSDADKKGNRFNSIKLDMNNVVPTLASTAGISNLLSRPDMPVYTNDNEWKMCGAYPMDYNFKKVKPKYLIGMSVPPVMAAQIAHQIYKQWFSKL
jgi:DNA (cytosine-5)-methyltransferase 1